MAATVILVDLGHDVCSPRSRMKHTTYAAKQLSAWVELRLGVSATRGRGRSRRPQRWHRHPDPPGHLGRRREGGADGRGVAGSSRAMAGASTSRPDLTVTGFPTSTPLGDIANIPVRGRDGHCHNWAASRNRPGDWAAGNILADIERHGQQPFHYRDKGIMAMIGRKAAVAEIGAHRHETARPVRVRGLARRARASCSANAGAELKAFIAWAEEFYVRPHHRSAELLDPSTIDTPRITGTPTYEEQDRCDRQTARAAPRPTFS